MFNLYPYTDFHEINLSWVINKIKELGQAFNDFEAVNKITNAGAWDITKQYQAWTIVSDNSMGYISLKPVPVGVAITNTEYWGLVADYDLVISGLAARVDTLETEVSRIKNRYFVFLGDSYSVGTSGGITPTNYGWVDRVIEMLGLTADDYTRCTVADIGALPSFWPSNASHRSWRDSIEIIHDRMSADDIAKVTDVVLCGGYNEIFGNDIDATYSGMVDYINYVKTNFPDARYWLGAIGMNVASNNISEYDARNFILSKVIPTYGRGSELGFICMGNTHRVLWNNAQTDDGIHPDPATYRIIGEVVANNLMGSQTPAYKDNEIHEITFNFDPSVSSYVAGDSSMYAVRMAPQGGTLLTFVNNYLDVQLATPVPLNPTVEQPIATVDRTYIPAGLKDTVFIAGAVIIDTNNNRQNGTCYVKISPLGTVSVILGFVVTSDVERINILFNDTEIPYPLILS